MKEGKYSAGVWVFGSCPDRFVSRGYKDALSLEDRLKMLTEVWGIEGVEAQYPSDFSNVDIDRVKGLLQTYGLELSMVCIDIYSDRKWRYGSLAAVDESVRQDAITVVKGGMDAAERLGAMQVNFWGGHDGFDYPFQADYGEAWRLLVEGLRECASYKPDVKLCIEYKMKEPRTHLYVDTAAKALLLANEVRRENVGVTLDTGHSLMAGENMAAAASLLGQAGKLFHLHFNDNYRDWDHDMIVGSVHLWEYLELLLWLKLLDYKGWYSLDMDPYREDPVYACSESFRTLDALREVIDSLDLRHLRAEIKRGNLREVQPLLRAALIRSPLESAASRLTA
ncbi:MAG: sugar phosphate isomerase/epimerase family protein [Candidatus Bathyarchaeia archaeon]